MRWTEAWKPFPGQALRCLTFGVPSPTYSPSLGGVPAPHSPSLGGCERQSSAVFPQKDAHTTTTKVRALRAVVFTLLGKLSNISSGGERFFFACRPAYGVPGPGIRSAAAALDSQLPVRGRGLNLHPRAPETPLPIALCHSGNSRRRKHFYNSRSHTCTQG